MEREQVVVPPATRARWIRTAGVVVGVAFAALALIRGLVEPLVLQVALIGLLLGVLLAVERVLTRRFGGERKGADSGPWLNASSGGMFVSLFLSVLVGGAGRDFQGSLLYWVPALLVIALPAIMGTWWVARRAEREA